PGLSCPDCSAASMTPSARRSFTDPRGLKASILTKRLTLPGASLLIFTIGVLPTVSRILRNLAIGPPPRRASLAHNASPSNGNRRSRCLDPEPTAGRARLAQQSPQHISDQSKFTDDERPSTAVRLYVTALFVI